jgi:hypothetical protein
MLSMCSLQCPSEHDCLRLLHAGTPLWKLILKQFDDLLVKVCNSSNSSSISSGSSSATAVDSLCRQRLGCGSTSTAQVWMQQIKLPVQSSHVQLSPSQGMTA